MNEELSPEPPGTPLRPRRPRRPEHRRLRRRTVLVAGVALAGVAVVFVVGLLVGRAIEDAPRPGGEQTIVRTLVPETVGPAAGVVTVTVTSP